MEEQISFQTIRRFSEFTSALQKAGMSMGGENNEEVFALADSFGPEIGWHTGDADTDPWEWRMRALNECGGVAYAKVFFKKSGFITKEWYPYFYAVRRGKETFEEAYGDGTFSLAAKRIYEAFRGKDRIPLHALRQLCGFTGAEKGKFDAGLTELQMRMYLTMCGKAMKQNAAGTEYGWASTVFCPVEKFFDAAVFQRAAELDPAEAYEKLAAQIRRLNPRVTERRLKKFIRG